MFYFSIDFLTADYSNYWDIKMSVLGSRLFSLNSQYVSTFSLKFYDFILVT